MKPISGGLVAGRALELMQHKPDPEWGYPEDRVFSFGLYHPANEEEGKKYPLFVALHCAGLGYFDTVTSILHEDNLDTLKTPADSFMLCLDDGACGPEDYWWGGQNPQEEPRPEHNGTDPLPTDKRYVGTTKWVIENYPIDENRVYGLGVSMGGSGTLGMAVPRGDIFAAVKVCVPAGVGHISERCAFENPDGVNLPDPPVVVEISAQNDNWSKGHEKLYEGMAEKKYPLISYWGNFGHDASNNRMPKINDLINTFDLLSVKKNEAYPVIMNASCNDPDPWHNEEAKEKSGQMNAFFRWNNVADTEDIFETEIFLLTEKELATSFEIPTEATADIALRRLQKFKVQNGDVVHYTFGNTSGDVTVKDGLVEIKDVKITRNHTKLTLTK